MIATTGRSTREVYRDAVTETLPQRSDLVCLDTDTGLFDGVDFGRGAARYVNLGIAEHTLMGAAAGLAKEGRRPLVHTMAAFAAARALEAVKVDIALNNLPVLITATHAGLSAGSLGPTHHALEDLAVMRSLPNMTVLVPTDETTTRELLQQALELPGPAYLRLGRNATPELPTPGLYTPELPSGEPSAGAPVRLGEAQVLRWGADVTLAACGPYPLLAAAEAAALLDKQGIAANVVHVHTVKPLDVATLSAAVDISGGRIVTVEEHWAAGGFGSAVIEALTELLPLRARRIAVPDAFASHGGDQPQLLSRAGITAEHVAAQAQALLSLDEGS